jgi:hypothetical protein
MIDVVICGNIRSEVALYEVLREVDEARRNNLLGQIVFSTWNSEGLRFPKLFGALQQAGVDVVAMDPPTPYTGSMPIQHLQFWRGLQVLDSKPGWVFRTRTDKAFLQTAEFFNAIYAGKVALDAEPHPTQILERKITFNGIALNEPFPHNDITFAAWKSDCRRILNFDAAFDYIFDDYGYFPVEARWVLAPIMARYPALKALFENASISRMSIALRRAAEQSELANAPDSIFGFLVAYWRLCAELFSLVDRTEYGALPHLEDLIAGRAQRPWAIHWGDRTLITSQQALRAIAAGRIERDPLWKKLKPHYATRLDFGAAVASLDPADVRAFADKYLPPAPPEKRVQRHVAAPGAKAGMSAAFEALLRGPAQTAEVAAARARIDAAIDLERGRGGSHEQLLALGLELAGESRATKDFSKAQFAHLCLLCAGWGRLADAVDADCALAYDGWVTKQQRREAFEPVYTIFVQQTHTPIGRFWYGIDHIYGIFGGVAKEFGMGLVKEAADMGFEPAKRYLAGGWEPQPPTDT